MEEIAVLSGKGGTGKSSLSAAFSSLEKNIVVADCDVDAANLHLVLKPVNYREEKYISGQKAIIDHNKCTGCTLCMEYCRFDAIRLKNGHVSISETSCDGCQLCSRVCPSSAIKMKEHDKSRWYEATIENGRLIHARLAPGEDNSGKLVNIVRDQARDLAFKLNSEIIIIDGPPGIGCPAISSLTGVDKVLLVTEPTQSGLHDLRRVVELVNQFKIKVFIIINKYDLNTDICIEIEDWCVRKDIEVIGKLPFDPIVVESMINCETITKWSPDSAFSKEITQIWEKLKANGNRKSIKKNGNAM